MGLLHDFDPRLVDVAEAFCLLRKLLRDVAANKHGLQVDPEILHRHPVLNDLRGPGQLVHPFLDFRLERDVVSEETNITWVIYLNLGDKYGHLSVTRTVKSKCTQSYNMKVGPGQLVHPFLDFRLERDVVSEETNVTCVIYSNLCDKYGHLSVTRTVKRKSKCTQSYNIKVRVAKTFLGSIQLHCNYCIKTIYM